MTEEKPFTRDNVLKLIKDSAGPERLFIPGPLFEPAIDLSRVDLHGSILLQAKLQKSNLYSANLQGTTLVEAKLQGAYLCFAKLQGADFRSAKLHKVWLYGAEISRETRLENVDWGPKYVLGEEERAQKIGKTDKRHELLGQAADAYRILKQWHTQAGIYDIAGEFHYREIEVQRKVLAWKRQPHLMLWKWALRLLCGYGEKPLWEVAWAFVIVLGLACVYSVSAISFPQALYFSTVSFTALGYGSWAIAPTAWVKGLGAAEAFIGVFTMALFLITFVRKMTR
jgi:hypothetical protein